jgi:antitoxin ParD1/3/4
MLYHHLATGGQPMNVSLTPELERWVSEKVDGERYKSMSDVVREGLLLLRAREAEQSARYAALKADIQVGLDEVERGELVDGEEAFARVFARIAQIEENGG